MLEIKNIIRFFETDFIIKVLTLFLLFTLLPVGEIFLLIFADSLVNTYILMAGLMSLSLIGFFITVMYITSVLRSIKRDVKNGEFSEKKFFKLPGGFIVGFLLIFPGIISFTAGIVILLTGTSYQAGKIFGTIRAKEIYEYLKLYDF